MGQRIQEGEVPEEIRLVNEFLNTLDLERFGHHADKPEEQRDELRSPEGARAWFLERKLLKAEENVSDRDRQLAVAVRDALRQAAASNSYREDGDGQALVSANRSFAELPLALRLDKSAGPRLGATGDGVRNALGRILADVAIAASRGTWARLKICKADDCRWAYYDHSKSRTGRWCSMETCGNRHKTRRYRRRRRDGDVK